MHKTSDRPLVRLVKDGAVATLTLARPHMQNALVPELLEDLLAALGEAQGDASVRAVVLAAEGPAFSIGGDMRRFYAEGRIGKANLREYSSGLVGLLNDTILTMANLPQPIVGAVHGTVTGGSLGLVLACDLIVIGESVVMKAHYASAGYCPDGGWSALLPLLIGNRRAAAGLLLNRSITADDALAWGLVSDVAATSEVLPTARAMAERIAGFPVGTMQLAKRLLNGEISQLAARLEAERRGFVALVAGDEALRGTARFLEKFTGYPGEAAP